MIRPARFARQAILLAGTVGLALAAALGGAPPRAPDYPDHTKLLVVRDGAGHETRVTSASDWSLRRAHIVAHLEEVTGPLPGGERRVPLDVKVDAEVDTPHYVRKKVTYASEPGDRVPAWLLIPRGPRSRAAGIVCLHQTVAIGNDEPVGLGSRGNLRYGLELAERGYVVVAPDYPGFHDHQVDPYALGYSSATMKAVWDNMRAIDLLASLPEVDDKRIGAIGHSLGGHNAILTAVFDERIRAVVSSCGFNSFTHYYGGNLKGWSHRGYMPRIAGQYGADPKRVPFDFPELIAALAPRAFFTNSPRRDANFEFEGVRLCLDPARGVYELLNATGHFAAVFPDAEHDFPPEAREQAYRFLDRELK